MFAYFKLRAGPRHTVAPFAAFLVLITLTPARGAPPSIWEAIAAGDVQAVEGMLKSGLSANLRDENSATLLMWAAETDRPAIVSLLLAQGANPRLTTAGGWTALHHAAGFAGAEVTTLILATGADANQRTGDGRTPLDFAALRPSGSAEMIRLLAGRGATLGAGGGDGWSALHLASSRGRPEAVRALLAAGSNVNLRDSYGRTPLMLAADNGQLDAATLLLKDGADPNLQNRFGATSLMLAAASNHAQIVLPLRRAGAALDTQDRYGLTALAHAALRGHLESVAALVQAGARGNIRDTDGQRAIDRAAAGGYGSVVEYLKSGAGADPLPNVATLEAQSIRVPKHEALPSFRFLAPVGWQYKFEGEDNTTLTLWSRHFDEPGSSPCRIIVNRLLTDEEPNSFFDRNTQWHRSKRRVVTVHAQAGLPAGEVPAGFRDGAVQLASFDSLYYTSHDQLLAFRSKEGKQFVLSYLSCASLESAKRYAPLHRQLSTGELKLGGG